MPHLRSISWKAPPRNDDRRFPFSVPTLRTLPELELSPAVTLLVGENGSGKSTLLEALALAMKLPTVGAAEAADDETLKDQRRVAQALRLTWNKSTHRGFFLRAEDFFGFQKRLAREQRDLRARLEEIDHEFQGASDHAAGLAKGPVHGSLNDIRHRYGENADAWSHGEAFLNLFRQRFVPGGIYLLDEPEAALSPQSQLGLLAMLMEMVRQQAQFIIATHSPILLAFPEAFIYSFDQTPIARVNYDDLAHVQLTLDFLKDPGRFLSRLRG